MNLSIYLTLLSSNNRRTPSRSGYTCGCDSFESEYVRYRRHRKRKKLRKNRGNLVSSSRVTPVDSATFNHHASTSTYSFSDAVKRICRNLFERNPPVSPILDFQDLHNDGDTVQDDDQSSIDEEYINDDTSVDENNYPDQAMLYHDAKNAIDECTEVDESCEWSNDEQENPAHVNNIIASTIRQYWNKPS